MPVRIGSIEDRIIRVMLAIGLPAVMICTWYLATNSLQDPFDEELAILIIVPFFTTWLYLTRRR